MKSLAAFALLVFCCGALCAQPGKQYNTREQRKAFFESLGKKYSSAPVREIFHSDGGFDFEKYVDGHSEMDLVQSYSTVIHELLHGYNEQRDGGYYYYTGSGRILVPEGKYFQSSELNGYVRKGLRDSVFRYGLYIGASQALPAGSGKGGKLAEAGISVLRGIYGLVEEYNAYYFGTLATYETYEYYNSAALSGDKDALKDYRHELSSDLMAYHEFRLFMGWYMLYAKQKHPDVYADILGNKALLVVFTLLEQQYADLAGRAEAQLQELKARIGPDMMEELDFSGSDEDVFRFLEIAGMAPSDIYEEESTTVNGKTVVTRKPVLPPAQFSQMKAQYQEVVKQVKGAMGEGLLVFFANSSRPIAYLKSQTTPAIVAENEKLKVEGVTGENWEAYLK